LFFEKQKTLTAARHEGSTFYTHVFCPKFNPKHPKKAANNPTKVEKIEQKAYTQSVKGDGFSAMRAAVLQK